MWDYNIDIAKELQDKGVDEVQFDYIRFPSDGDIGSITWRFRKPGMGKMEALESFLAKARESLSIPISTDVYGYCGWARISNWVAQNIEMYSRYVDVIQPMFYPSHFPRDFLGTMEYLPRAKYIYEEGTKRSAYIVEGRSVIRPYVQAFRIGAETCFTPAVYSTYLLNQVNGDAGGRRIGIHALERIQRLLHGHRAPGADHRGEQGGGGSAVKSGSAAAIVAALVLAGCATTAPPQTGGGPTSADEQIQQAARLAAFGTPDSLAGAARILSTDSALRDARAAGLQTIGAALYASLFPALESPFPKATPSSTDAAFAAFPFFAAVMPALGALENPAPPDAAALDGLETDLTHADALMADSPLPPYLRGEIRLQRSQPAEARALFEASLSRAPGFSPAALKLSALILAGGGAAAELPLLQKLAAGLPTSAMRLDVLARAYLAAGKPDQAADAAAQGLLRCSGRPAFRDAQGPGVGRDGQLVSGRAGPRCPRAARARRCRGSSGRGPAPRRAGREQRRGFAASRPTPGHGFLPTLPSPSFRVGYFWKRERRMKASQP